MDHFGTYLRTYVRTYVLTYVQVIFRRSHPTLKLIKQKMSKIIQVNVPNFFYFAEILKMTELRPKNRFFGPEIPKDSKKAKTEDDSYSGMCPHYC